MKVKATRFGYFEGRRREGAEFEVPDGTIGSWFEPVPETPAEEEVATKEPVQKEMRGRKNRHQDTDDLTQ
jgi:hypothetical protein